MNDIKRRGHNGYGFVAEVNGKKMEFATDAELKEYEKELEEKSDSSFLYFRKIHTSYNSR